MSEQQHILEVLQGDDAEQVREAAYSAGELRLEAAVPHLVHHLQSQNIGVQEAADNALRKIGGATAVGGVIPLLRSDDAPIRNISMDILRDIGCDEFDSLKELLHDEDPDIRIFASDILGTSGNILAVPALCEALLRDPEVNVRYQAAVSLGTLAFPEAADCLNKAMQDEEWVQFSVIEALTKIRAESSVNALVKALDSTSDLVASMIVDALGEMGNLKAVPLLLKRIEKSPTPLRNKIVRAVVSILGKKSLSLLGEKEQGRLAAYLLAALEDEDEEVQDAAIIGLASLGGPDATVAVLKLAAGLDPDRDHERLEAAIHCIGSIGYNEAVEKALGDENEAVILLVVEAAADMDPAAVTPALIRSFWEKGRDAQRAIATQLARIASLDAADFFLDLLDKSEDAHVIKAALHFLGHRAKMKGVGDRMLKLLDHQYDDVKEAALEACIALHDPSLNESFKERFHSADPLQRMMSIYAMGRIDVDANLDALREALFDEVPDVRKVALEALAGTCPITPAHLELVVPLIHDPVREVRLALVDLFGACPEEPVVGYLLQALDDEDDWVRVRAVEALGRLGRKDIVEPLLEHADGAGNLVLLKTIEALGAIGGNMAFRALLALMEHDDPEIQQAAEDAVVRMGEQDSEGD